nr:SPFH domain-containing protein [Streptomyces sp. CoH27]
MPIPSQQVITRDTVSIGVAAVAYFRRVDPVKSTVEIEDVSSAISQIAQTTVRNVVGRSLLDQVLTGTVDAQQPDQGHPRRAHPAMGYLRVAGGAEGH